MMNTEVNPPASAADLQGPKRHLVTQRMLESVGSLKTSCVERTP